MTVKELYPGGILIIRRKSTKRRFFLFRYFTNRALILFSAIFLLAVSMFFVTSALAGEQELPTTKTITCVQIEAGDTLWSIANSYYSEECGSMEDYIQEIKKSNGLKSNTIHRGAYLIIPYYTVARQ